MFSEEGEGFYVAMNILNSGRFVIGGSMSGCIKDIISKAVSGLKSSHHDNYIVLIIIIMVTSTMLASEV